MGSGQEREAFGRIWESRREMSDKPANRVVFSSGEEKVGMAVLVFHLTCHEGCVVSSFRSEVVVCFVHGVTRGPDM
jgi:hypothetical protein